PPPLSTLLFPYLTLFRSEVALEEFEDPTVLIGPRAGLDEAVVLDGIDGHLPVGLPELDQPLREPDNILEVDVRVDHPVRDEERRDRKSTRLNSSHVKISY